MSKVFTGLLMGLICVATAANRVKVKEPVDMSQDEAVKELVSAGFGIFTKECFDSLFVRMEVGNVECIKLVVSKVLGYTIIVGSFILKLPQIIKILQARDVTGLMPSSFYLEVLVFQCVTIYNVLKGYPISTWGENIVILIQNVILVLLLWTYSTPRPNILYMLSYVAAFGLLSLQMYSLREDYHWIIASTTIPISCAARIPQIMTNFSQGHTGQMALGTLVLNFGGSIARLFTTLQETGDVVQIAGFLMSASLNGILVLQVFIFWTATNKALENVSISKKL